MNGLETLDLIIVANFFFFHDTATTEIYTLSLHDALPIFAGVAEGLALPLSTPASAVKDERVMHAVAATLSGPPPVLERDRKSTRLNSSHSQISYAVFCLKKKTGHKHMRHSVHGPPHARSP